MSIVLHMRPQDPPIPWSNFVADFPPYSVAIDGFVEGPPRKDLAGPRVSFNHHEGVARDETRATCAQVLMAIRRGLFDLFQMNGERRMWVYANDCDQDVCLSWALLEDPAMSLATYNPRLHRLVQLEDFLDTTGGAYPFPLDLPILGELAWVFEPYTNFRLSGRIDRRVEGEFLAVVEDVRLRIRAHLMGTGKSIVPDPRFDVLEDHGRWAFVREIGAQARTAMLLRGIKVFLTARERPDGRLSVSVARMSPYVSLDCERLSRRFNLEEGCTEDQWGGGDTFTCSPRNSGTALPIDTIKRLLSEEFSLPVLV